MLFSSIGSPTTPPNGTRLQLDLGGDRAQVSTEHWPDSARFGGDVEPPLQHGGVQRAIRPCVLHTSAQG